MVGYISVWRQPAGTTDFVHDVRDIVRTFSGRVPWQLGRRILETYGVPVGHGWEKTIADLEHHDLFHKVDLANLHWAFLQHLCCGEKSVRSYDIGSGNARALRQKLLEKKQAMSRIPRPKSATGFKGISPHGPKLDCIIEDSSGIYAVYSTVRTKNEEEEIDIGSLPEEAREALPRFDELIAVRTVKFEAYGTIWVSHTESEAEIRCDCVNESQKSLEEFHQQMYKELHAASGSSSVMAPRDLFPAVKNIYDAEDEGIVMRLGFVTTTGSVKVEKMRSHESLRQETYHVGGKKALRTEIEPFKLGVRWSLDVARLKENTFPELYLDGTQTMVGSPSAGLTRALIKKAAGFSDFDWVRNKLLQYI